jgi:hypothetical protein
VGPRAVLDAVVKRKILSPSRESNPRTPVINGMNTKILERLSRWWGYNSKTGLLKK